MIPRKSSTYLIIGDKSVGKMFEMGEGGALGFESQPSRVERKRPEIPFPRPSVRRFAVTGTWGMVRWGRGWREKKRLFLCEITGMVKDACRFLPSFELNDEFFIIYTMGCYKFFVL